VGGGEGPGAGADDRVGVEVRLPKIRLVRNTPQPERALSYETYQSYFTYLGQQYQMLSQGSLTQKQEELGSDFTSFVQNGYKSNGVVFACILARMMLFSEARFQFRRLRSGRPGDLFGTEALGILENPGLNKTTGDLLAEALVDVDLSGNWYGLRQGNAIRRLYPAWVTIVMGSKQDKDAIAWDLDSELLGYIYKPGGAASDSPPVPLLREQVAHFAPIKDPQAVYRGMSWIQAITTDIQGDQATTIHKQKFFEQGATPNVIMTLDPEVSTEAFEKWQALFEAQYGNGAADAYKTWFIGGGAKAQVIGANMQEISFAETQAAGERRIAAAAGVPLPLLGLTADQATPYSAYPFARRRMADVTLRPLWRNMAASLSPLIQVPKGAELWYDDRDIAFLKEDIKDAAEVAKLDAETLNTLFLAGYDMDAAVEALVAGDFARLKGKHTGVSSVQQQGLPGGTPPPKQLPPAGGTTKQGRDLLARLLPAGD
jgi:hypothetical protein